MHRINDQRSKGWRQLRVKVARAFVLLNLR